MFSRHDCRCTDFPYGTRQEYLTSVERAFCEENFARSGRRRGIAAWSTLNAARNKIIAYETVRGKSDGREGTMLSTPCDLPFDRISHNEARARSRVTQLRHLPPELGSQ